MSYFLIKKFYNLSCFALLFLSVFVSASCVSAQDSSSQNSKPRPSSTPQTAQQIKYQSVKSCKVLQLATDVFDHGFDPLGGYQIIGNKPVEFADFDNFTLDKVFEENTTPTTNEIVGGVVIKDGNTNQSNTYQIDKITLSAQEIYFSTEILSGVHYEFSGKFLKKGDFSQFNEKNIPILKGTLKKFRAENLAAEKEFNFKFNIWKAKFPVSNC